MTTTIAINNHKGGVAKTTTCTSLAACLAELGHSVLMIDLDSQAHLTMSVGLAPDQLSRTVSDALLANRSLLGVSQESQTLGLDIVPANRELALIDKLLYRQKSYEYQLRQQLQTLPPELYDFVLIDCSPALNTLTLNAFTAADLLIIPIQCEYYAVQSLRQIVKLSQLVRRKTNPDLRYQVLVTMFDQRNKISRLILSQMRRELSKEVLYQTVIGIDVRLKESPAFGKPITEYAPGTRASRQYRALARELVARLPAEQSMPQKGSLTPTYER